MKYPILILATLLTTTCYAQGYRAKSVEKAAGNVVKSVEALQHHWETIPPKSKEECLKESNSEINNMYARCRNGWQEFVRIDTNGRRLVTSERPIPANYGY